MQVFPLLRGVTPSTTTQRYDFDLSQLDFRHPNLIQARFYASYEDGGSWTQTVEYRAMIDENRDPLNLPILIPRDSAHGFLVLNDTGPFAAVSPLLSLHPKFQIQVTQTGPGVSQPNLYVSLVVFSHRSA